MKIPIHLIQPDLQKKLKEGLVVPIGSSVWGYCRACECAVKIGLFGGIHLCI